MGPSNVGKDDMQIPSGRSPLETAYPRSSGMRSRCPWRARRTCFGSSASLAMLGHSARSFFAMLPAASDCNDEA